MFKFIHAADIHLDSPLKGLEQYEGAPVQEIRGAARRALANLVDLAIEQRVAFVLIAGDIYDGDWRDYNTGLFFVRQAARLRDVGIPLYVVSGNHDAANRMTRSLRMPDNVTLFADETPETAVVPDFDVAIHGQSYATAAVLEDLSEAYPNSKSGLVNIGLLHTCATGREGHDRYAPCSVEGLKLKGYDYWALGHVHVREVLCEDPYIAFSGNIQGRLIRETGPKGCLLVTVADDRSLKPEFRALDVLRWESALVDVSGAEDPDEVLDRVASKIEELHGQGAGRPLAVRVELHGPTRAHRELLAQTHHWTNEIRSLAIDVGKGEVWIEKVKLRTTEPVQRTDAANLPDGAIGELTSLFEQARSAPDKLDELEFDFADVVRKLPAELKHIACPSDPEWIQAVLSEAESLLLSRLIGSEVTE
ncbi:MAG: metallophosphoesterase family protein [bacterium]